MTQQRPADIADRPQHSRCAGNGILPPRKVGGRALLFALLAVLSLWILGVALRTAKVTARGLSTGEAAPGAATAAPLPTPHLSLTQSEQRDPLPVTWRLRYTIRLENAGTEPLHAVSISDTLPAGTYFVSADMGGIHADGIVTWTAISLAWGFPLDLHLELGTRSWLRGTITNAVVVNIAGFSPITVTETTTILGPTGASTPTPTSGNGFIATPTATPAATPTATRNFGPTPSLVATPRFPTPVKPTPASGPPVQLPPVIFVMLDFANGDWANPDYYYSYIDQWGDRQEMRGHPEYGALGGWQEFHWDELNPHPGVYNWSKVDKYILDAQDMHVTLPDGSIIAKPVGVAVATWTTEGDEDRIGTNHTPSWVAEQYGVDITSCYDPDGPTGPCRPFCTPNFMDPIWQYYFDQFILAMGQHYDGNPAFHNLAWINIATGVDGETNERKSFGTCAYDVGNAPAFDRWVGHVMETYNRAFPHTPQFIQATLEGLHHSAILAASLPSRMTGVKANGLSVDHPNAEIRYDGLMVGGVSGFSQLYHQQIPTGFEPGIDPGVMGVYWMLMEGLYVHPYLMDIQLPMIANAYEAQRLTGFPLLDFVRTHLGKTPEDTPDVWIVLRETRHSASCWAASSGIYKCYGPHYEDFEYWLYRRDDVLGSRTVALLGSALVAELPSEARSHIYSYHSARRTDQATGNPYMSFDVEDSYLYAGHIPRAAGGAVSWTITLTLLNKGTDTLSLEYVNHAGQPVERRITKGAHLGPLNTWVDYTWHVDDAWFDNRLPGGLDFRIDCNADGNEYIHRLIVRGEGLP